MRVAPLEAPADAPTSGAGTLVGSTAEGEDELVPVCASLVAFFCALQEPLPAQEPAPARPPLAAGFRYRPGRIQGGRLYRYRKSNQDGTHPSEIALYVAGEDRLEALKWQRSEPEATLVQAEMDWEVFSARSFRTWRLDENGERRLAAELETSADRSELVARVGELTLRCALERFPWHSYDFDLASLNIALRFLEEPEGQVELGIVDPVYGSGGPELVFKGTVSLRYDGDEERSGLSCRRYSIDGEGLENRGGLLWAAKEAEAYLVGFEIDLPDEPGMSSGKLQWVETGELSAQEWAEFVRTRGEAGPREPPPR